ncbi:MAG: carboxypeptidase-like regulatory domain-containing protein [Bacteroidales bacterium]|nr:carboxypeptidase-like regulatory domain-containing protein [Bacteroidales bacterium]
MRKIFFLFFFVAASFFSFSQDTSIYVVTGKIIDAETLTPIPMAYLLNTTKRYGAQTDTSGKFRILLMRNDIIRISSIGYITEDWKPDFSKAIGNKITETIYLIPKTYNIGAIDIYSTRWNSFLYAASQVDIEEDITQKKLTQWVETIVGDQNLSAQNLKGGIQIPLPIYTHREKMLKKIQEQQQIDELNKIAAQKFNKNFVSRVTGLVGTELDEFMGYCKFDRDFILRTSEYDLIIIVQDIYEEFKLVNN